MNKLFCEFSNKVAKVAGTPWAFVVSLVLLVIWAVTGPFFGWSETWQLVVNTGTTIITFLMVFLIQNTQNRDTMAVHAKLDELIRAVEGARNKLIRVEDKDEETIETTRN